jgi:hypothetical protein
MVGGMERKRYTTKERNEEKRERKKERNKETMETWRTEIYRQMNNKNINQIKINEAIRVLSGPSKTGRPETKHTYTRSLLFVGIRNIKY